MGKTDTRFPFTVSYGAAASRP